MEAKRVYEALSDILKPKEIDYDQEAVFRDLSYDNAEEESFIFDLADDHNLGSTRGGMNGELIHLHGKIKDILAFDKEWSNGSHSTWDFIEVNEGVNDVLKPREDINDLFAKHGITDDQISTRIRKPPEGYNDAFLKRVLKGTNTTVGPYKGPVPEEEHESGFVTITGSPWGIFNFRKNYFLPKYKGMTIEEKIEDLKNYII